jgi:hypothetical protein
VLYWLTTPPDERGQMSPKPEPSPSDPLFEGLTYGRAKNAFWLGFFSLFCFGFITGLPAVFVGAQALSDIAASEGKLTGRGTAWLGVVLGCVGTVAAASLLGSRWG